VFVSRWVPAPLDNGARIRTHELLRGLSGRFETVYVGFEHRPPADQPRLDERALEARYPGIRAELVTHPLRSKRASQALSLAGRRSWTAGRYRSEELAAAVRRAAAAARPCVVHYDDFRVVQIGAVAGALSVYSPHNVEHRILRQGALTGSLARRLFYRLEAAKVQAEEEQAWRSMDISLAVSPVDARAMRDGGARRIELCPNGAPDVEPLPFRVRAGGAPLRLVFVGSGDYLPYERGLAWLVRDVLPRIASRLPVSLEVVGEPPRRPVQAEGVRYVGRVPSVEPYYAAAHGVVVPVFEGSGTRLKILEAMAYGRPVVSTRLGAEGLPITDGRHFLEADDPEAFAAAALRLGCWSLQPTGELERLLDEARVAARTLLWPAVSARLADLYEAELARLR
jgi:glycosyltransferase involved in cell wall biosynthesis